jgi:hypothetical protein
MQEILSIIDKERYTVKVNLINYHTCTIERAMNADVPHSKTPTRDSAGAQDMIGSNIHRK